MSNTRKVENMMSSPISSKKMEHDSNILKLSSFKTYKNDFDFDQYTEHTAGNVQENKDQETREENGPKNDTKEDLIQLSKDINELSKRLDKLESFMLCRICRKCFASVIFLPCNHQISCSGCSLISQCICGNEIKEKIDTKPL